MIIHGVFNTTAPTIALSTLGTNVRQLPPDEVPNVYPRRRPRAAGIDRLHRVGRTPAPDSLRQWRADPIRPLLTASCVTPSYPLPRSGDRTRLHQSSPKNGSFCGSGWRLSGNSRQSCRFLELG